MSQYSEAIKNSKTDLKHYIGEAYEYIPEKSKVLDVGCSTGYFGKLLIEDKKTVVDGIEYDPSDAKKAKKVLGEVFSFDLDSPVWPKELLKRRYDVIFFGDVLEHLKYPKKALENFSKLLNTDGKVIISIPNIAHVSIRLEVLSGNFDYEKLGILDETHLKYFTFISFTRLLADAGYKVVDYSYSTAVQPKETIEDWLDKLGLKGSQKFYDIMGSPEATAYQYRFVAELGKPSKLPVIPVKPLEIAKNHAKKIDKLYQDIDSLKLVIENKRKEVTDMRNSVSWKITKPLRTVKNTITRQK